MTPKLKKYLLVSIATLSILAIIIIPKLNLGKNDKAKQESKGGFKALPVKISVIKSGSFENQIIANGTILSNESVDLSPESAGKIVGIFFREGSSVRKDELLVKINDAELQGQLQRVLVKKQLAVDKEYRYKQLQEKNNISKEEYDIVAADLKYIEADIEVLNAQIAKTEIKAPFDGIIGLRAVSVGTFATTSMKIVTLQSLDPIKIEFSIPQQYYSQINVGNKIKFEVPNSGSSYIGDVYAIEPKVDVASRTLKIRATASNPGRKLSPGAYVDVKISLEKLTNAIMIPTETLVPDIQGEIVYLYSGGKAISKKVKSGMRTENSIQIIEGLAAGDSLITSGIIQLKQGLQVTLFKEN